MTRRRVAIIGAGFSGTAVAVNALRLGRDAPDVVLIERRKRFGPGLAYGGKEPGHLLNVRAYRLSALADKPDHFSRWLARNGVGAPEHRFMPRKRYGAYMEHVLGQARRGMFGPGVKRVRGDAVACTPSGEGWRVTLASGEAIDADAVVLAMGNALPPPPAVFADVPIVDPWDSDALRNMPPGDVLLLGAGLTMIDAALTLAKHRKSTIYALSRRGIMPRGHTPSVGAVQGNVLDLPDNLSDALHVFRAEVRAMAAQGLPWQYAMDRLRTRTPELWRRLPLDAQKRFLRHLRPWWDVHRHRAAPEIAARVAALRAEGRLRLLAGHIVAAERNGRGVLVHHRGRGSYARHRLPVAAVVNCTGASLDPRVSDDALIRQLLADGVAHANPNGLGFDIDADGRVLDAANAPHRNLYALGPITMGAFWECTAIPEIRVRAAAVAMMVGQTR